MGKNKRKLDPVENREKIFLESLGPGLITGASDDDPSGIATYSQVGAQFGFGMLWTMLFTYPLMGAVQEISARIGRVTGHGIARNIREHYPRFLLYPLVSLLFIANIINLGADVGAMGAALQLIVGGPKHLYAAIFGVTCLVLQIFIPYKKYVPILKWLTLSLFSYVATVFVVDIPWKEVILTTLTPNISFTETYITSLVAVFGTTISPYLFFWQASQEVEEQKAAPGEKPLKKAPSQAKWQLPRIKFDTYIGMAFSNIVAFFIILTTAVTLHTHGITDIKTSSQAAEALRPIAGNFAFLLFSVGIIGTGLLAVPVLAGSAAYAVGEAMKWRTGLAHKPGSAKEFYGVIAAATLIGIIINFTDIDPIKALYWSAVINGIIALPIMVIMMAMASKKEVMGKFIIPLRLKIFGWIATGVMAAVVICLFVTWGK